MGFLGHDPGLTGHDRRNTHVGADLAKNVIQVHAVDGAGRFTTMGLDARLIAASFVSPYRMCEGFKEERTACINRIRGMLAEFDLAFGKSPKVLRAVLADAIG